MKIDKVFIINLEHRKDRKEAMIKQMEKMNITNYEFFKAIKPIEQLITAWNPNFLIPMPQWFLRTGGNVTKYKIGALGCMLSHIKIIKICLERNYENVLILEDDTEFLTSNITFDSLIEHFSPVFDTLDFGLIYLCGNHVSGKLIQHSKNIYKVTNTLTTGSYIINKKAMEYIDNNIKGYCKEIDVFYANHVQKDMNCYTLYPHVTKQANSYSDIVQQNVNYKM